MLKLNLSKTEYSLLLDLLSISHWVLHAYPNPSSESVQPYTALQQKILSCADQADCNELVDYSSGRYYLSTSFEDASPFMSFVQQFEEDTFWDELVGRMVLRDMINRYGETHVSRMSVEERAHLESAIRDTYEIEFLQHGLFNLVLERLAADAVPG